MDKPRQQNPLSSQKTSSQQGQKPTGESKKSFSQVAPGSEKKAPLSDAKPDGRPAGNAPQKEQPQQQKTPQAAPGSTANKGK